MVNGLMQEDTPNPWHSFKKSYFSRQFMKPPPPPRSQLLGSGRCALQVLDVEILECKNVEQKMKQTLHPHLKEAVTIEFKGFRICKFLI